MFARRMKMASQLARALADDAVRRSNATVVTGRGRFRIIRRTLVKFAQNGWREQLKGSRAMIDRARDYSPRHSTEPTLDNFSLVEAVDQPRRYGGREEGGNRATER